jgi:lysophospholipase L1-like esterase
MAAAKQSASAAGYDLWDLYEELRGRAEPYWATDGLHFNDAGHAFIASAFVERYLNTLIG